MPAIRLALVPSSHLRQHTTSNGVSLIIADMVQPLEGLQDEHGCTIALLYYTTARYL